MTLKTMVLVSLTFTPSLWASQVSHWERKAKQTFSDEYLGPGPVLHYVGELRKKGFVTRVSRTSALLNTRCTNSGCQYQFLVTDSYGKESPNLGLRSVGGVVSVGLLSPYRVAVLSPDEIDKVAEMAF